MGLMSKRSSAARQAGSKSRTNSENRDFMRGPPMRDSQNGGESTTGMVGTESAGWLSRRRVDTGLAPIEWGYSVWYHPRDTKGMQGAAVAGPSTGRNLPSAGGVSVDGGTTMFCDKCGS